MIKSIYNHSYAIFLGHLSKLRPISFDSLKSLSVAAVIRFIFTSSPKIIVLQVGANDGTSNDPLYPHLRNFRGQAFLVEALPYYYEKLKKMYANSPNIKPVNVLLGEQTGMTDFFYIDPVIAEQMDGEGPMNKWAHGQGSQSRECIVQSIYSNSFRGITFQNNITNYIDSIFQTKLDAVDLASLCQKESIKRINFLVLDVQGYELSILHQIPSLDCYPAFVMCEVDESTSDASRSNLVEWMLSIGYVQITSDKSDSIFGLQSYFSG
jgi:FkbM family methyltransferase